MLKKWGSIPRSLFTNLRSTELLHMYVCLANMWGGVLHVPVDYFSLLVLADFDGS